MDEDIESLFSQLTEKEIKSICFRISRNESLTLKTAKLVLACDSNIGTIKCLGTNLNISKSNSPEKDRINFLWSQPYYGTPENSESHFITTSEEDSEKDDKSPSNNSAKPYNLRSKK